MGTIRIALLCALALFAVCSKPQLTGTIDESDTGILGKVTNADLSAAPGATVRLFVAGDTSKTSIRSTTTDASGAFSFLDLAQGTYNIWADGADSSVAFVDSIFVPQSKQVDANATLGKPGSLCGIVALQPGHSPKSVTVQALGTNKYANIDSSGRFTVFGLAVGEYTLRFVSTISGYTPTYLAHTLAAGANDTLADTVFLVYTGIPPVTGIKADYDPFTGIVKLTWNAMRYEYLYNYRIYRDAPDAIVLSAAPYKASVDTALFDTLYSQDNSDSAYAFRYRVTIYNKMGQEGATFNYADVRTVNPVKFVQLSTPSNGQHLQSGMGVKLAWNGAAGAAAYRLHVSSDTGFADTVFQISTADTTAVISLLPTGVYHARIQAQSKTGLWGKWSAPVAFSTGLFSSVFSATNSIQGADMTITSDKGYLIAGTYTQANSEFDVILIKTDSSGKEQWRHIYNEDGSQAVTALKQISNGYVVTGTTSINQTWFTYVLKVDLSGAKQWMNTVGDSSQETATSLDTLQNGSLLIGMNNQFKMPLDTESWMFHIRSKYCIVNSSGALQSQVVLDTATGGTVLAGRDAQSFFKVSVLGDQIGDPTKYDTLSLAAISYSGSVLWTQKTDIGHGAFSALGVRITDQGKILVWGNNMTMMDLTPILFEFSANGALLSTLFLNWGAVNGPSSLAQCPSGGYYIVGRTGRTLDPTTDIFLTKISDVFSLENTTVIPYPGYQLNAGNAIVIRPDNSPVIAATIGSQAGASDVLLFSTTPGGQALLP